MSALSRSLEALGRIDGRSLLSMALAAAGAMFVLAASPAAAESHKWYSRSKPLNAHGGYVLVQAQAYGTAYQKNAYLKNHTYYRDPIPGGDKAYTETTYSYFKYCNNGSAGNTWCKEVGKDQSKRSGSAKWVNQYDQDDYTTRGADRGRVHVKVCADKNNKPDPCSRKPYYTFSL